MLVVFIIFLAAFSFQNISRHSEGKQYWNEQEGGKLHAEVKRGKVQEVALWVSYSKLN